MKQFPRLGRKGMAKPFPYKNYGTVLAPVYRRNFFSGSWEKPMTTPAPNARDERVLIFLPSSPEISLVAAVLPQADLACQFCANAEEFFGEWKTGGGTALLAEEALSPPVMQRLVEGLGQQPPWSDFPLVVFFGGGDKTTRTGLRMLSMLEPLGNVTILERPARVMTLVSAVQAALRARRRQYEVRDLLLRLEEAVRRRDEFLGKLVHELRNPLHTIRAATQILDQLNPQEGKAVEQRGIIGRQTRHLTLLIDDLLDVSGITSGKILLQRQNVDLNEVARQSFKAIEEAAQTYQHQVSFQAPSKPLHVEGDPKRLEQVLTNLLANAVRFTPPGGQIRLTLTTEEGLAVVRVRDNGAGIAPDLLPRIFNLFTPEDYFLDRPQGGLGIGLTLVRSLVEMHGGSVRASSAGPGKGSEFVVRLPLAPAPPSSAAAKNPKGTAGKGQRVLLVEDNPDGRETLRLLLHLWGHQVEVAADGIQGVEKALAQRPDVALVDIGLPGLNGYQVANRLRDSLGSDVYLIAMTGYGQPHDRRRAMEAGFDAHMVKPVDPEELGRLLAGVGK